MPIKAFVSSLRWAHVSLFLVGLMWVLPFLYYRHALPITTFYQEWGAAVLGVCAMSLLASKRYWQQPEIPRIVLLPIGLMLLVLLQSLLGRVAYFSHALLSELYFLWAALLIMLGHRLRVELGLPQLVAALAVFLLLGTELGAFAGILQNYRWHTILNYVVSGKVGAAVVGNMGQPNHYADYTTMGLISLGLLRQHWNMRAWLVVLLAAPLLFVLVLSGSRSAWLYLLFLTAMAYLWQRRDKSCVPLLRYSMLLLLGFALMHLVVQLPWLTGVGGTETTLDRMSRQVGGRSIRMHIWHEAWYIFTQFPLLGAGFGQFGWQHFLLGPTFHNTDIQGLYNNAHNMVMQTAAEMGLAGLLVLLGTLALWLWQARKVSLTSYHWWGYGIVAVLGIHSMLEYPLWYVYFLGVLALTLGLMDNTTFRLELRGVGRLSLAAMLLLGVLTLLQAWQGYRTLEGLRTLRPVSAVDENYSRLVRDGLVATQGQALLQPYAELVMSSLIEVSPDHLAEKRFLNESAMHFVPSNGTVYREALLLALSGEQEEAQRQIERAIWAYPGDFQRAREQLRALALKDPAHFAALLEFALKKNEEYQLAVSTK